MRNANLFLGFVVMVAEVGSVVKVEEIEFFNSKIPAVYIIKSCLMHFLTVSNFQLTILNNSALSLSSHYTDV